MHAFDRHTDRQTEFSLLDRVCIPCSAVKTDMMSSHNFADYYEIWQTDAK